MNHVTFSKHRGTWKESSLARAAYDMFHDSLFSTPPPMFVPCFFIFSKSSAFFPSLNFFPQTEGLFTDADGNCASNVCARVFCFCLFGFCFLFRSPPPKKIKYQKRQLLHKISSSLFFRYGTSRLHPTQIPSTFTISSLSVSFGLVLLLLLLLLL